MTRDNTVKLDTFSTDKKYLVQSVGREQVNDLHKQSKPMDFVIVFGWVGLVVLNSICIYFSSELHGLAPLMFVQGLLLTQLGLIGHQFIVCVTGLLLCLTSAVVFLTTVNDAAVIEYCS